MLLIGVSDLDLGPLFVTFLSSDTTPVSSGVPTQSTSTLTVAGVAVTAVVVLLVVAVVQSAVIWHQQR